MMYYNFNMSQYSICTWDKVYGGKYTQLLQVHVFGIENETEL